MEKEKLNLPKLETAVENPIIKKESFFKEIFKFVLLATIIVLPIRLFIAQPFIVSGASMDPTFASGQYLIVDQISYRFENPKRGDVIIFRYPFDTKRFYIKRIIALPLETIDIQNGHIAITGKDGVRSLITEESYVSPVPDNRNHLPITLKNDEYFVMGDNRTESSDSRVWGAVKSTLIIGKPFLRLFPVTKVGIVPGSGTPTLLEATEKN